MAIEPGSRPQSGRLPPFHSFQVLALAAMAFGTVVQPFSRLTIGWALLTLFLATPSMASARLKAPDVFACLLVGLTVASLTWTRSIDLTWASINAQAACAALFIAVRVILRNKRDTAIIAAGFLAGAGVAAFRLMQAAGSGPSLSVSAASPRFNLDGINANSTSYALAAAASIGLVLAVAAPRTRILLVTGSIGVYSAILLTGTRGSLFAVAAIAAWAVMIRVSRRRHHGLYLLLSTMAVLLTVAVAIGRLDTRLAKLAASWEGRDTGTLNGRLEVWPIAREAFTSHPILGQGAGTFPSLNSAGIYSHNAVLDMATGLGIVGLVIGFCLVVSALHSTTYSPSRTTSLLKGSFIATSIFPLLSGYWFLTVAFWLHLALLSRLDVFNGDREGPASSGAAGSHP